MRNGNKKRPRNSATELCNIMTLVRKVFYVFLLPNMLSPFSVITHREKC